MSVGSFKDWWDRVDTVLDEHHAIQNEVRQTFPVSDRFRIHVVPVGDHHEKNSEYGLGNTDVGWVLERYREKRGYCPAGWDNNEEAGAYWMTAAELRAIADFKDAFQAWVEGRGPFPEGGEPVESES